MVLTEFQLSLRFLTKPYYQEPHRAYHTWEHIQSMLNGYQEFFGDTMAMEEYIAIVYHDIVYKPWSDRNEQDSMDMLTLHHSQFFPKKSVEMVQAAKSIILDTKHNGRIGWAPSERVMDLDLMVLGKSEKTYDKYKKNTRREYAMFNDIQWYKGRMSVLNHFLAMSSIYRTEQLHDAFEIQARTNILKELYECEENYAKLLVAA